MGSLVRDGDGVSGRAGKCIAVVNYSDYILGVRNGKKHEIH